MSSYVKYFIDKCKICRKFSISKIKEPLLQHEVPELPFQKIGIDIAEVVSFQLPSCYGLLFKVVRSLKHKK